MTNSPTNNERAPKDVALAILLGVLAGGVIGGWLWYLDFELERLFQ